MNLPNLLTLSRIPILFGIVALLYLPFVGTDTAAFFLFIIGVITDWADGHFARKMGIVSNFGKLMDALTDKIFMVGLFITLLASSYLPPWALPLLLLILSREFLITGLRLVAASSGIVLAAEKSGKQKTAIQMTAAILILLSIAIQSDFALFLPSIVAVALHWIGVVCFCLATLLTVTSGFRYLHKYWAVFTESSPEA